MMNFVVASSDGIESVDCISYLTIGLWPYDPQVAHAAHSESIQNFKNYWKYKACSYYLFFFVLIATHTNVIFFY